MSDLTYRVQAALRSLGQVPGPLDGTWGPRTKAAAEGLVRDGYGTGSLWAARTLQEALTDLGWSPGPIDGILGPKTLGALSSLIVAGGLPRASAVSTPEVFAPTKPALAMTSHGNVIRQGNAGYTVDHLMQHTTATPGTWWRGKTNQQMLEEVRGWHINGRGWRDIGYHEMIFPDGEWLSGRPSTVIGAGAIGYNRGVIHITMVPIRTIETTRLPEDFYTPETLEAMRQRIANYAALTPLRRLSGHREVAAKLCPGFEVIDRDWTDLAVA